MTTPRKITDCQACGEEMELLKADTAFFVTEPKLINCSLFFCSSADCKEMGRAIVVPWETLRTEDEFDD